MSGSYLWLCFGGTEIVSQCLTQNLQGNGHGLQGISCAQCACCDDMNEALYGGAGGGSITDAPWYDKDEPLSTEFAGLLVTSIEGLQPGNYTRSVTESARIGASLGQARQLAPEVTVTGILLGSCCGADYGFHWLQSALQGDCDPGTACAGADLQFLSCEPLFRDADCVGDADKLAACLADAATPGAIDACNLAFEPIDYEADLVPYIRTMKNVALISGPTITNRISHGCPGCHDCKMLEVQFTLSAADPHVYREPVTVVEVGAFEDDPENDQCIEWVKSGSGLTCGCSSDPDCATDPLCQDIAPPSMPTITNSCIRGCLQHDRVRSCFTIPEGLFPANGGGTLRITINAGNLPMRNVFVQGWVNPLGFAPEDLNDCDACFGVSASYVAPSTSLVIDGTTHTSTITCAGGAPVRANPFIAGGGDSPLFSYPDFAGCSGPYTVCVYADSPVGSNASIRVEAIGFEG